MRDMNWVLWIHLAAALLAVNIGVIQLLIKKGGVLHRYLGYLCITALIITAISSFGIQEIGGLWGFSWIHGLSLYTLVGIATAILYARQKDIRKHKKTMQYLMMGIFIAGVFTLLPGRRLGDLIWTTFS